MNFRKRLALAWRILTFDPARSGLMQFAERETGGNCDEISEILLVFATQGHSGGSASVVIPAVSRLLSWQPLAPLTGEENEWTEIADGEFQNKRCSTVFKSADKGAYDLDGYLFEYPDGVRVFGFGSTKPIAFPYTPGEPPVIVKVADNGSPILKKWRHLREGMPAHA